MILQLASACCEIDDSLAPTRVASALFKRLTAVHNATLHGRCIDQIRKYFQPPSIFHGSHNQSSSFVDGEVGGINECFQPLWKTTEEDREKGCGCELQTATGVRNQLLFSSVSLTHWENTGKGTLCRPHCDSATQSDILFSIIMAEFIDAAVTNHSSWLFFTAVQRPSRNSCTTAHRF